jgi:hypothetical protein
MPRMVADRAEGVLGHAVPKMVRPPLWGANTRTSLWPIFCTVVRQLCGSR